MYKMNNMTQTHEVLKQYNKHLSCMTLMFYEYVLSIGKHDVSICCEVFESVMGFH